MSHMCYTRFELFTLRRRTHYIHVDLSEAVACGLLRYRGSRGGKNVRNRRDRAKNMCFTENSRCESRKESRPRVLVCVSRAILDRMPNPGQSNAKPLGGIKSTDSQPSMYLLNAAALAKPHAIEQLAADLTSYNADIGIITETHFKAKHTDSAVSMEGYTLFRRDRPGRKGGGVALYVRSTMQASEWKYSADDRAYEVLWVRINNTSVAAIYHPPKPLYRPEALLEYIESCMEELNRNFPASCIVVAGDLNAIPDNDLVERTGLIQIVHQPTRGSNILDRIFVSDQQLYSSVRVVASVVKSDHKAVVVYSSQNQGMQYKIVRKRTYRLKSPRQHAQFLDCIADMRPDTSPREGNLDQTIDTQAEFDAFYSMAIGLLNQFYPERTITITSRDPDYINPEIKAKLRRKNKLMRVGRTGEAGALAIRIGKDIQHHNRNRLQRINERSDAKDLWAAVRKLTGRQQDIATVDGISAESLNDHYAAISTDINYTVPLRKQTTSSKQTDYISEWEVFRLLDKLRPTATGLDQLPAWFLRLGAPIFSLQIAHLFNLSISTSIVPKQWKQACIRPIPKVSGPKVNADFRPISITPVLTRVMEKTVVRHFLYPTFLSPPASLTFNDQFAFRPSGSTTAAIITLLHIITNMLLTNPYVIVICLDFSKAFDTVRHSTLLEKLAQLDLPDNVYNWMVEFFNGHTHCTHYHEHVSTFKDITASVIQGSGIGPAVYVVNAADLMAMTIGNQLCKFADDTYLVIPATNVDSRTAEIDNIEKWSQINNLTLNRSKSKEIVFRDPNRRRKFQQPLPITGIVRVASLKILGVTITNSLSVSSHVSDVIGSCAQSMYALRVLRAHGMAESVLQAVYRSVVVAKLMYASSAWWGLTSAADRQRLGAFLRRSKRGGFCPQSLPPFEDLCKTADKQLFTKTLANNHHLLHALIPSFSLASQNYHLRERPHNRQLPERTGKLTDSNFIVRQIYSDIY